MALLDHMREKAQSGLIDRCDGCPIKGTEYCHKVNPMAMKYTRAEKKELREAMDKGQTAFKEAK
mgnify:CR=1 FL=1